MMRLEGFMSGFGSRPLMVRDPEPEYQEVEVNASAELCTDHRPKRSSAIGEFLNQRINLS